MGWERERLGILSPARFYVIRTCKIVPAICFNNQQFARGLPYARPFV